MAGKETEYDAIVRAEIAIEILNQARAIITARVHELETKEPAQAERLRQRRRDLVDLQHGLRVDEPEAIEDVIAVWGARVSDEDRFGREF